MILSAPELPQYKGDKKIISGSYTDPSNSANSFTFDGCQIDVQGTSSAPYARKNYDLQFKNGFTLRTGHADNYALAPDVVPFKRFVIKADVASSEGANNVVLVKLFCDINPFRSREEQLDPKVRQGIYGFPIVVFWNNTTTGETSFLGKYNFNLPKRAPEPYGYSGDMESWEFQNNTSNNMLFKDADFTSIYVDVITGDVYPAWKNDWEARFPNDEWEDIDKLKEFAEFVVSTRRDTAIGDAISPVTYDGVTYTTDTAEYRLAKFKNQFPTYADLNSFVFYYIFTELFLMVDSRAKNLFIGFNGPDVTVTGRMADRKAVAQPYDMDTGLGTNNEGSLVFGYSLEDTDHLAGGANIFNGQDSVLWCNLRDAFKSQIATMYKTLRSQGTLSYASVEQRYEDHQSKWPEAVWIEDTWFKYIDPLINPDPGKEPTAVYLPMMQGSKEEQRKWWLSNRFQYMDSKWVAGDAIAYKITLRGYEKADIVVTPYIDLYPTVDYASTYLVQARGQHGQPTTLACPMDALNDTEIYIHSAPYLASVGDLSGLKVGFADFSAAVRLQHIKVGDSSQSYENRNLTHLVVGSNKMLKTIDARNCISLGTSQASQDQVVELANCPIIEEVYFDGTSIKGVTLPDGGMLRVLHLPGTITTLNIKNQNSITDLTIGGYSNLSTLIIENSNVDARSIINSINAGSRVRLTGFYWEAEDAEEIEDILDLLDTMIGVDEGGYDVSKAVLSGTIHTDSLTGAQIASYNARYPYLTVTADNVTSVLYYKTWDGSSTVKAVTYINGVAQDTAPSVPSRASSAQYNFTAVGWNLEQDASVNDPDCTKDITGDRTVYAAYSRVVRTYTATFMRASEDGGGTLYTQQNIPYGTVPTYGGSTPTTTRGDAQEFTWIGWTPELVGITSNTTYYAVFKDNSSITRQLITRKIKYAENSEITSIGQYAFTSCHSLTTASFPAVTDIGAYAFIYCTGLQTISFPSATSIGSYAFARTGAWGTSMITNFQNVTYIGNNAFMSCSNLQAVNFPVATEIGSCAFQRCSSLTTVSFPVVTSIGASAFDGCSSLTTASFPVATSIGSYAFYGCSSLTTISFPSVTIISANAFNNCSRLATLSFPSVTSIGNSAFQSCSALTTVSFPVATSIGGYAFQTCVSLTTASFPVATSIGSYVFYNCVRLTSFYLTGSSIPALSNSNAFTSTPIAGYTSKTGGQYGSIFVPSSLYQSYLTATNWSYFSSRFVSI